LEFEAFLAHSFGGLIKSRLILEWVGVGPWAMGNGQ